MGTGHRAAFERLRLLVVEDHAFQRGLIVTMAQALGVRHIAEATNGVEALKRLTDSPVAVDVVICDLDMPEMDGVEFLHKIRERGLEPAVIIVSGHDADILRGVESMARGLGLRVLGRVQKPLSIEQLVHLLSRKTAADAPRKAAASPAVNAERLGQALDDGEIRAVFQPKVALADGSFTGAEALARWTAPGLAPVFPSEFIPAMLREDLSTRLTDLMLAEACRAAATWRAAGLSGSVAVNVSAGQLLQPDLVERLVACAARHGVEPARITLEIPESELATDATRLPGIISRLRLKGCGIAVDDFGTGHSSLAQLTAIPFTEIKIDGSFVRDCDKSLRLSYIVKTAVELSRRLSLGVVAEGVLRPEEWQVLATLGCDEAQGYLIGAPMAAEHLPAWAADWRQYRSAGFKP